MSLDVNNILPGEPTKDSDPRGDPSTYQSNERGPTSQFSDAHITRFAVFLILEAAFTALAWYCYVRPRALPESLGFQDTTIKSGFIAVFSVWHTIAVTSAFNICAEAFSREWAAREGQETDAVSTVTSGFIDRVLYFFRPRATRTYQVAFLAFLGLLLMRTTGPSAITVSSGVEFTQQIPIGLISTVSLTRNLTDLESENFFSRLIQANMIVRLERLIGVPWGYEPEPNWLIPLPNDTALQLVNKVAYNTDLVSFHHSCHWQAPEPSEDGRRNRFMFDNESWSWRFLGSSEGGNFTVRSSRTMNGSSITLLLPDSRDAIGKSVFLVLGGNISIPVNSTDSARAWIDLSHLPSLYDPKGFVTNDPTSPAVDWVLAPLASLLVCDPHLSFTTGNAILDPVANLTSPDVKLVPESISHTPSPGNIDPEAARALFTFALAVAVGLQDTRSLVHPIEYLSFNSVAAQMFLQLPESRNWSTASAMQLLDIETINKHIDVYTRSALKAFTSGYKVNSDLVFVKGGVYETQVDAYYTRLALALATSVQFAILHTVLFGLLGVVLAVVAYLNVKLPRLPFSLKHIKQA